MVRLSECDTETLSLCTEEEIEMTMQVGMVGVNGIVMVSDQLAYSKPNSSSYAERIGIGVTSYFGPSKIFFDPDCKMAICCAQDLRGAGVLAEAIIKKLSPDFWTQPISKLKDIAREVVSTHQWKGASCMVLLAEPMGLYVLQCAEGREPDCDVIGLYCFTGDACNPATFWARRYFTKMMPNERFIEDMLPLAAQIVIDAGLVSSGNVDGLEAVYCDKEGIHRLDYKQNGELFAKAIEVGSQIQEMVLACPDFLKPTG